MCDQELRDELMTLLVAGHETTASELAWAFERLAREPRRCRTARRRDRLRRRRRLRDRDDAGDAAPPARCSRTPRRASSWSRSKSVAGPTRRASAWCRRVPGPPRPGDLSRPLRVPARALPRRGARHLHVDPVRRRAPSLHRRQLRPARDEDRAARRARRERAGPGRARPRARPPAQHHAEPRRGRRAVLRARRPARMPAAA